MRKGSRGSVSRLLLAIAIVIASTAVPASSQAGSPVLGDGTWRIVFFLEQRASLAGVEFDYSGHGSAIVDVGDGSASGEWNLSLSTVVVGEAATSNGVANGTISGTGAEQVLDFSGITVTDAQFGITITLGPDDLPTSGGGTFTPTGRGCSAITGKWVIPFNDQQLEGTFIAQRLGAGGGETDADLRDDGIELIEQAQAGSVDISALQRFIQRAEQGSEATARDEGCDLQTSRIFGNAATVMLNTVLVEVGYSADALDDSTFIEFYRVVLRSGLFETEPDTRLTWEFGLLNRLGQAISSDDPAVWRFWLPIARQLGETEAAAEMARNICRDGGHFGCENITG